MFLVSPKFGGSGEKRDISMELGFEIQLEQLMLMFIFIMRHNWSKESIIVSLYLSVNFPVFPTIQHLLILLIYVRVVSLFFISFLFYVCDGRWGVTGNCTQGFCMLGKSSTTELLP